MTTGTEQNADAGGAGGQGGGQGGNSGGEAQQHWSAKITDPGIRDFATNKGYTKLALEDAMPQVLQSYGNLEKLMGADRAGRTVELPNWDATDEAAGKARDAFWDRVGRPKEAKDYVPNISKGGVKDPDFANAMAGMMHKAGVPLQMATTLTAGYQEYAASRDAAENIAKQQGYENEKTGLKTEWGAKYDDNMKLASNAAKSLGVKPEVLDTLQKSAGYADVMRMFQGIAVKMGEATFVDGERGSSNGTMSPAEAKAEMTKFINDKDNRAILMDKHHPKHKELMARKSQLAAWEVGQTA